MSYNQPNQPKPMNGFHSVTEASPLINIRYSLESDVYAAHEEEYMHARLKKGIIEELFNNKELYAVVKSFSKDENKYRYSIDINISKQGYKFSNVINDEFRVQNEGFTEEELINAVQIAYPERFI